MVVNGGIIISIVLPFVIFVIGGLMFRRWLRKFRSVAARQYLVCPKCEYDLRGLGSQGTCPECGTAFDAAKLERQWEDKFLSERGSADRSTFQKIKERPLPPME